MFNQNTRLKNIIYTLFLIMLIVNPQVSLSTQTTTPGSSGEQKYQKQRTPEEIRQYGETIKKEQRERIKSDVERQKEYSKAYRDQPLSLPPTPVPLSQLDPNRFEWSMRVANLVNPHFSIPYQDNPNDFLTCADGTKVYRPNHSLAHGLRQAYLAVDIAVALKNAVLPKEEQDNTDAKALQNWVLKQLEKDPNYLKKLEFSNAFQRSGRQSDISKDQNPARYNQYLQNDQANFQAAAEKYIGELFKDQAEIDLYKQAITDKFEPGTTKSNDLVFLSRILYTAHTLDLRRLHTFDKNIIIKNISKQLFGTETPNEWETNFIQKLWDRSGDYLNATGDRDMEDSTKRDYDKDVFCAQAHNPQQLVTALQLARTQPESTLLKSIVSHVQTIRQIKEKNIEQNLTQEGPYPHTEEEQERIQRLRETLEKAPYTASEAYLKISLEDEYIEIPFDADEEFTRQITRKNILTFLRAPKRESKDAQGNVIFLPRIENPDEHYVQTLVNCLMEERKNRGKIVLYHATEPEMGFFYDVYTQIRNQLIMAGGRDIRALRVLDEGFLRLDREMHKATMRDFMKKFHQVADDAQDYRDLVLSTNFSLFGSDQQSNSDTYNMFYRVKDINDKEKISTQRVLYESFLQYIQKNTGIPLDYEEYKEIFDRHVLKCQENTPCQNGRLIQNFIDPEVLVDVGYLSVVMGAPVLKDNVVPSLDEPLMLLRTKPMEFHQYLLNTKGGYLFGTKDWQLRPNQLELHDLQVRFFMRPEVMFNPRLIQIKSDWRFGPPQDEKGYYSEIDQLTNKNIVSWLKMGAPAQPEALIPETVKLHEFTQKVYTGSTGSDAPKAPAPTLEQQFVQLLDKREFDAASRMLSDHAEEFLSKTFVTPPTRAKPKGESLDLITLLARRENPALVKTAFDKGIFPGGEETYKVYELIKEFSANGAEFLKTLNQIRNPSKVSTLFLQYFSLVYPHSMLECYFTVNAIVNKSGNEAESVIVSLDPLFKLLNYGNIRGIVETIYGITDLKREDFIKDALFILSYLAEEKEFSNEQLGARRDVANMLRCLEVMKLLGLSNEQSLYILSVVRLIYPFTYSFYNGWERRLNVIYNISANVSDMNEFLETLKSVEYEFEHNRKNGFDNSMPDWEEALTTQDEIDPSEKDCPNKGFFRGVLSLRSNYLSTEQGKKVDFDFNDKGQKWRVSNINFSVNKDTGRIMKNLNNLKLLYNTGNDKDWCLAQFNDGHINSLTMSLHKVK